MAKLQAEGFVEIDGARLEYRMVGPLPDDAPTLVMLHEGLGSVGLWGEFPRSAGRKDGRGRLCLFARRLRSFIACDPAAAAQLHA